MTEVQPSPASAPATPLAAPPGGPGLQAAWRVVQAAEQSAASGHEQLCWAQLRTWPAWALAGPPAATWLAVAGACWHASEIRQCIDGARLQALRDVLGAPAFAAVLRLEAPSAESELPLPPNHPVLGASSKAPATNDLAELLQATGRRVALASLADADLRAAVAVALAWSDTAARVASGKVGSSASALPAPLALAWLDLASEHARA